MIFRKKIRIKYFDNRATIEQLGDWSDLRSREDITYKKGDFIMAKLGVAMELPKGYEAHIVPRSSTFKNYGLIQTNSMGVIDNAYSGDGDEWRFPAIAMRDGSISKGDRICQFRIIKKQPNLFFKVVTKLGNKDRNGFGSTGKK